MIWSERGEKERNDLRERESESIIEIIIDHSSLAPTPPSDSLSCDLHSCHNLDAPVTN